MKRSQKRAQKRAAQQQEQPAPQQKKEKVAPVETPIVRPVSKEIKKEVVKAATPPSEDTRSKQQPATTTVVSKSVEKTTTISVAPETVNTKVISRTESTSSATVCAIPALIAPVHKVCSRETYHQYQY